MRLTTDGPKTVPNDVKSFGLSAPVVKADVPRPAFIKPAPPEVALDLDRLEIRIAVPAGDCQIVTPELPRGFSLKGDLLIGTVSLLNLADGDWKLFNPGPRLTALLLSALDAAVKTVFGYAAGFENLIDQLLPGERLDWLHGRERRAVPAHELTAPDPGEELLRTRFLCRGGGLLLVGESGKGKSSLVMQFNALWALGRSCFGIEPPRPLSSLLIQSENDAGDLWEIFNGIVHGLRLSTADAKAAGQRFLIVQEDSRTGDVFLREVVERLLRRHHPDMLTIDPAQAFLGGDTTKQVDVGQWLRCGLNPLLHRYGCGCSVVHHVPKPRVDQDQSRTTGDFLYGASGSAEWTNWARAVLHLEDRGRGVYRLHAPKRGGRIGWRTADGEPDYSRYIRHSSEPGTICWLEASEADVATAGKYGKSKLDLLALVPREGQLAQTVLLQKGQDAGIGIHRTRAFLDELLGDGTCHRWLIKRHGTRPEQRIGRTPQPPPDLLTPK